MSLAVYFSFFNRLNLSLRMFMVILKTHNENLLLIGFYKIRMSDHVAAPISDLSEVSLEIVGEA